MNIYKLPVDAYNRKHEQTISEDVIKDKLIGETPIYKDCICVNCPNKCYEYGEINDEKHE